jgi:hypothetical protein
MADFYYFMAAYLTIGRQVFHVHSILCFISFNCHCLSFVIFSIFSGNAIYMVLIYYVVGLFRKDFPVTLIVSTSELSSLQENFSSVLENRKIRNRSEIVIVNSLAVFATDRAF